MPVTTFVVYTALLHARLSDYFSWKMGCLKAKINLVKGVGCTSFKGQCLSAIVMASAGWRADYYYFPSFDVFDLAR